MHSPHAKKQTQSGLRSLLEASPFAVLVLDAAGRTRFWSAQATEIFGWSSGEVIGRIPPFVPPDKLEEFMQFVQSSASGERLMNISRLRRRRDGSPVWIRAHAMPIGWGSSETSHILTIIEDMTESTRWQTEGRKYELLVKHTPDMMLFTDESGQIIDANPAALEAYGYSLAKLRSMRIHDLRDPITFALSETQLAQFDQGPVRFETLHCRKDGTSFPVEVVATRSQFDGNGVVMSLIRDMTARKQQQLYRSLISRLDEVILQEGDLHQNLDELGQTLASAWRVERVTLALEDLMRPNPQPSEADGNNTTGRARLQLPLLSGERRVGTLAIEGEIASPGDLESLEILCDQLGAAIGRAQHQQHLRLLETALEASVNGVVISDARGLIEWVNPGFTALTGYTLEEVKGQSTRILKSGFHAQRFYESMWQTILAGEVWRGEMRNRRKDGTLYEEEMTVTPMKAVDGTVRRFIAVKQDISRRKLDEDRIAELSSRDSLTGLPNRGAFEQRLAAFASLSSPSFQSVLVVLDIDQFKLINASHGFDTGDRLLVEMAQTLLETFRGRAAVARLGDDEFAVLLPNLNEADARRRIDELMKMLEQLRVDESTGERAIEPTISVGAVLVEGGKPARQLLNEAERALLTAKTRGSGYVEFFDQTEGDASGSGALVEWSARIRDAIRNNRFVLYAQPVVRLETGQAEHAEVLLRLREAGGGLLPPGQFLPLAESLQMMPLIDRWVSDEVVALMRQNPKLRIFVNLSGQSLGDEDFRQHISLTMTENPDVACRLTFEVTETSALRNLKSVREWMERLRSQGCRFALDDFGAGFSSFAYLRELPVDYVKLDGSFVRSMDDDYASLAVVRALVDISHAMGKIVIAEWVESPKLVGMLSQLGVEFGQGYALGEPAADLW